MSLIDRVYIDASVLGYKLLTESSDSDAKIKSAQQSESFFKDIENGKYQGVISTLTQIEYLGLVKRAISRKRLRPSTKQEEQIAMTDLFDLIDRLGIGLGDSDELSVDSNRNLTLFRAAFSTMDSSVVPYFDSTAKQQKHKWKNIGGTDAVLVNLATRMNAKYFATFDKGFLSIVSTQIKPLIISNHY